MFALLKFSVSGYKMLEDNYLFDFVSKARVDLEVNDNEIIEVDNNLYVFNMYALTGSNSSGKTTTLNLLSKIIMLLQTGRWIYDPRDFNKKDISLSIDFYMDGRIYKYSSMILKKKVDNIDTNNIEYCNFKNEKIFFAIYESNAGKRYDKELSFNEIKDETKIDDTSKLIFLPKKVNTIYLGPHVNNGIIVNEHFFQSFNSINETILSKIIQLLDESIEYIKYNGKDVIIFKRFNEEPMLVNKIELLNYLSNGTIKGIELFVSVILLLKRGGIMLIDEIEDCFNKNLVNNILLLFCDKKINKHNSQIIFTTHYVEILDIFERRDNIFVLHKDNLKIKISNVYDDYDIRTEILKSKQFNNNTFGTLVNYDRLMQLKRAIKNEISRND